MDTLGGMTVFLRLPVMLGLLGLSALAADMTPWGGWNIRDVSAKEYGARWPFTVDKGMLGCKDSAVVFRAIPRKGVHQEYAVNGIARGRRLAGAPQRDVFSIVQDAGAAKKSVAPIIEDGLKLCK